MERSRDKVRRFLADRRGMYASPEVLDALAASPTRRSLEFAATVLTMPGWRHVEKRVFENHSYRLEIGAECGGQMVQLLFKSRWSDEATALDIVKETPEENRSRQDDERARLIRGSVKRYVRLTTKFMPKALRWLMKTFEYEAKARARSRLAAAIVDEAVSATSGLRDVETRPLVGRTTTGDMDWSNVPPPVRHTRLYAWLSVHRMTADVKEEYLPVLAQCETTAEMRFLVALLKALPWKVSTAHRLTTPAVELRVQTGEGFDFAIRSRSSKIGQPFAVEIVRAQWAAGQVNASASLLAAQKSADGLGFKLDVVASIDAASRGAWWAKLVRDANKEFTTSVGEA